MIFLAKNEDRYQAVKETLDDLNPVIRGTIVIKPDLPGTDAATGAFTQISFVRAVIDWARERGNPKRIFIVESAAEGHTQEIFRALGYDKLIQTIKDAKNIELLDCNADKHYDIEFVDARGEKLVLPVSATVIDADFVISLSLLKTHDHVALGGALPNLSGFVVGAENKIRMHGFAGRKPNEMDDGELAMGAKAYSENLLTLYNLIEPDLAIVDGNGQEGNGPVKGTPKTTDLVIGGDDVLRVDALSARIMGFVPEDVPYLQVAEDNGLEPFAEDTVRGLEPDDVQVEFAPHKRMKQMQIDAA